MHVYVLVIVLNRLLFQAVPEDLDPSPFPALVVVLSIQAAKPCPFPLVLVGGGLRGGSVMVAVAADTSGAAVAFVAACALHVA